MLNDNYFDHLPFLLFQFFVPETLAAHINSYCINLQYSKIFKLGAYIRDLSQSTMATNFFTILLQRFQSFYFLNVQSIRMDSMIFPYDNAYILCSHRHENQRQISLVPKPDRPPDGSLPQRLL